LQEKYLNGHHQQKQIKTFCLRGNIMSTGNPMNKRNLKYLIVVVLAVLIPLMIKDNYIMHLLIVSLVWATVVTNWNLTLGYGGMFHIDQPTFLAVGAYAAGISSANFGISPWLSLFIGGFVASFFSMIIGIPCLRVKGIYLILLTFAFHFTVAESVFHLSSITGGSMGLVIPTFELGKIEFSTVNLTAFYYIAAILLALSLILTAVIVRSNLGKALIATRDSEVLAMTCGINLFQSKLVTFTIAAFTTGVAGAFYAHYIMVIGPELFSFGLIVSGLGMIVIGGMGTLFGPVLGSFIIIFLSEFFRSVEAFRPIIVGVIIILVLIFAPNGLIHEVEKLIDKLKSLIGLEKKGFVKEI
jgi:branched-chain amino acid transport system permease protein